MQLSQLTDFCSELLSVDDFRDYCPNGLQVEAGSEVNKLICGVTASQALIDAAVDKGADAILVHHGYFWKGESLAITGYKAKRVGTLMRNGISLLAYHLPLDAHPTLGNNVQLATRMSWPVEGRFGDQDLIFFGHLQAAQSLDALQADLQTTLASNVLTIEAGSHAVSKLAWCTGAAQGFIEAAAEQGADAFVSGGISEPTVHLARELGIHYLAAGHHATERYGVQALAAAISEEFGLEYEFIDVPNPV